MPINLKRDNRIVVVVCRTETEALMFKDKVEAEKRHEVILCDSRQTQEVAALCDLQDQIESARSPVQGATYNHISLRHNKPQKEVIATTRLSIHVGAVTRME